MGRCAHWHPPAPPQCDLYFPHRSQASPGGLKLKKSPFSCNLRTPRGPGASLRLLACGRSPSRLCFFYLHAVDRSCWWDFRTLSAPALISITMTATAAGSFFNQPSVASSLFGGIAFYCKSVTRVELFTFGDMRSIVHW